MKTLIIDAASIDSMYTIHDRFIAAFDFAECYGETLDSLHDYLCEINKFDAHVKIDRKSTRLNSSHSGQSRMPSSA